MQQRSPEWHAMRKTKIGSSDAPAIMGVGYMNASELLKVKAGKLEVFETEAMRYGTEMESIALCEAEKMLGIFFSPEVLLHPERDWMMSSLDGLSLDGKIAIEIKCPYSRDNHIETLQTGKVPARYYPQLQHTIEVARLDGIYYFSYHPSEPPFLQWVKRDDDYIQSLIEKEEKFLRCMRGEDTLLPVREDEYFLKLEEEYDRLTALIEQHSAMRDAVRDQLQQCVGDIKTQGTKFLFYTTCEKGRIDYSKIEALKTIDLEPYRGKQINKFVIRKIT